MRKALLITALSAGACVTMAAAPALATEIPIPGTGYASFATGVPGTGDSGTDAFGNPWEWNLTLGPASSSSPGAGFSAWGTPGLGAGEVPYGSSTPANDFEISFLTVVTGASILETPSPFAGGYNEFTRFDAGGVEWTPTYVGGSQVIFTAPAGTWLTSGEDYFVNVVFTNGTLNGSNAGFSAVFTATVPEAPTWAMMLLGFAGLGYAAVRRGAKGRAVVGA
jgi:hypothetical protein